MLEPHDNRLNILEQVAVPKALYIWDPSFQDTETADCPITVKEHDGT